MNRETVINSQLAQKFLNYYQSLAMREQLYLKLLLIFLLLVFVVFALLLPAGNYNSRAQSHYQTAFENLQWMQQNKARVSDSMLQKSQRDDGQSLLGVANNLSKGYQLSFKRYEPVGENGLSLWMDNIVFNNLILWLERLEKRHGINVQEISVEGQGEQGLVNVRLVLQG
jgi:general secretion pathway protein M